MTETTPKIHFLSLISISNDADLLPYFLEHYDALGFDNNVVFLHDGLSTEENELCDNAVAEMGWKVRHVPVGSSFGEGRLRQVLFDNFRKVAKPGDYIVCANADEFQIWEEPPQLLAEKDVDVVVGRMEDRYNDILVPPEEGLPLDLSYPSSHPHLSKVLFPKRPRLRDKIVMAKCSVPVDYRKSNYLEKSGWQKADGVVPILHYKWREGLLDNLRTRTDYSQEEIESIKSFFTARERA
jgi:hypothetical protein